MQSNEQSRIPPAQQGRIIVGIHAFVWEQNTQALMRACTFCGLHTSVKCAFEFPPKYVQLRPVPCCIGCAVARILQLTEGRIPR